MIKTIKVKKKLRLDELIKYVIDKGLNSFQFTSDNNVDVYFSSNGYFLIAGDGSGDGGSRSFELADTFTVEVEEEITEDTVFDNLVATYSDDDLLLHQRVSIKDIKSAAPETLGIFTQQIYAVINGKLQLIWEAE